MSTKITIKPRKHKHKDEMKQDIVVQVHKTINSDPKMKQNEDKAAEHSNGPSRDVSVDEESQINSKILSLIESEIKRDAKHAHFTDSRPQSLSFYEDEKVPEELSGNLELLSPEERKHYKRRKEHSTQDEERNIYNAIQDLYNNEDDLIAKKSKKKKRQSEPGIGDSREMMIPKEKRKSKKKKRDLSPKKNKHKKGDDSKTDITVVLDELQDDVFDTAPSEDKPEKIRKSPRKSDKLYVQKKNRFEAISRVNLNRQSAYDFEEEVSKKRHPIEVAMPVQEYWMRFTNLCHGLLAGLALGHWLYIISNYNTQDQEFILHYSYFSGIYVAVFYMLCTVCLISVYEKLDVARFDYTQITDLFKYKTTTLVIWLYFVCLIVHLSATEIDYKLGLAFSNATISNITSKELTVWNHLSSWRSILAFLAWIILGLSPQENIFYIHLKNMETYLPDK